MPFRFPDQLAVPRFSGPGFGAGFDEIPGREIPDGCCPADASFLGPVDVAIQLIEFAVAQPEVEEFHSPQGHRWRLPAASAAGYATTFACKGAAWLAVNIGVF